MDFTNDIGPPVQKPASRNKDDAPSTSTRPGTSSGPVDHTSPSSADPHVTSGTSATSPEAGSNNPPDDVDSDAASSENEYEPTRLLEDKLKDLSLDPLSQRYFGKSSPFRLLQTAAGFGSELSGKRVDGNKFWRIPKPPQFVDPYRVRRPL